MMDLASWMSHAAWEVSGATTQSAETYSSG